LVLWLVSLVTGFIMHDKNYPSNHLTKFIFQKLINNHI
jgi:hypothetical protein